MLYLKPLATCRSGTALKRPDGSKQCHCLEFAYKLNCLATNSEGIAFFGKKKVDCFENVVGLQIGWH